MSILKSVKAGEQVLDAATSLLNDAIMPPQEKADKTVEFQERTGSTPSSQSRRWVTKFMIIFIASMTVINIALFRFNKEWGEFAFEQLKEFCSNWVIITIVAFFYGGYYVTKNLSPRQKQKLEERKYKLENQKKEDDLKLRMDEADANIKMKRKQDRISYRNRKRNRP